MAHVQVFFVDYGNTAWVSEGVIRQMLPQFMHVPFQARQCRLPLVSASSSGDWSEQAL